MCRPGATALGGQPRGAQACRRSGNASRRGLVPHGGSAPTSGYASGGVGGSFHSLRFGVPLGAVSALGFALAGWVRAVSAEALRSPGFGTQGLIRFAIGGVGVGHYQPTASQKSSSEACRSEVGISSIITGYAPHSRLMMALRLARSVAVRWLGFPISQSRSCE